MSLIIYIIAFLEGFTTLSIEIIAIRNFTPIIGTNSISTSIILGIILLALSYGYYIGGKNSKNKKKLKEKVILNLSLSAFYYLFFSFVFGNVILTLLLETTKNYFFSILLSSFLLFFIPVFLASQTIPILSEILKGQDIGEKIGKLLFFSTIGSFLGSLMTSSIFFSTIGVEKTATLNSIILSFLSILILLTKKKTKNYIIIFSIFIFSSSLFFIFQDLEKNTIFSKANSYQNIDIYEIKDKRIFALNSGFSSGININSKLSFFNYIKEIKSQIIKENKENIAIIGAAGFTLPYEISKENFIKNIDVVDVDGSLKKISEKYFLQEKLNKKVNFIKKPSRYFLNQNKKYYDSIVVDVYVGKSLSPQNLTFEFFKKLKNSGKDIYLNIITDKNLSSNFSKTLFSTIKKAFSGKLYYKIVTKTTIKNSLVNIVISNKNLDGYKKYSKNWKKIYTDDKNSIELDLFNRNIDLWK